MQAIRYGRLAVTALVFILSVALFSVLIVKQIQLKPFQVAKLITEMFLNYVLALQITILTLMTCSITYLFIVLRKQQKSMKLQTGQRDQFRREKCILLVVLIIFDLSYALRAFYESTVEQHFLDHRYIYSVCNITVDALPDLVPILLILILHHTNFTRRSAT